jgi:hypothetical protein
MTPPNSPLPRKRFWKRATFLEFYPHTRTFTFTFTLTSDGRSVMDIFSFWAGVADFNMRLGAATVNAAFGVPMTASLVMSSSLTFAPTRRRSTANLTVVASNNWTRSHRSTAKLTLVSSR